MTKNILKISGVIFLIVFIFNSCFKDDLLKEIDVLKSQVSTIQKRNDSLNNVLNVRADSLSKALSNAQKRSDSLANVLRTKSDSLSLALGLTNASLANLTKSVDSIKTQIATISGQLTQLNLQLTSITTQLTQLNQQLGALGGDVSQLAAQYQALSASLQTINNQIAALQAEQLKLLEKLNAILLQLNPPIDLTTGLVAYYPFSGNAGDSSGNGNHGIVNGATLTTDRFGKINSAYSFNNNTISAPYKSYLTFSDTRKFSISIWTYEPIHYPSVHYIGLRSPGQISNFWNLFTFNSGLAWQTFLNPSGVLGVYLPNQQIPINTWTNIICTYENGAWSLYLNGILVGSANSSIAFNNDTPTPLEIGNSGNYEPFLGRLDDIRIYNRALTQSEITYLATH